MAASGKTKRNSDGRLGIIGICVVVIIFGAVMFMRTKDAGEQLEELKQKQEQLEERLEQEELRSAELEEKRIYVQTKLYVEEMAKKLGLVYPNEIIYRPSQD